MSLQVMKNNYIIDNAKNSQQAWNKTFKRQYLVQERIVKNNSFVGGGKSCYMSSAGRQCILKILVYNHVPVSCLNISPGDTMNSSLAQAFFHSMVSDLSLFNFKSHFFSDFKVPSLTHFRDQSLCRLWSPLSLSQASSYHLLVSLAPGLNRTTPITVTFTAPLPHAMHLMLWVTFTLISHNSIQGQQ